MLVKLIALFLVIALYLYLLLGGADFGAGIIELFLGKHKREEQRKIISSAIGPVWEANHIWLIIVVVILFNGFPQAFYPISVFLHVPITVLLIGIVLRGCAFTFRHYDAVIDRAQNYYSRIFTLSSVLSSFMIGMLAGGIILGEFPIVTSTTSYFDIYIKPWVSWFSLALGGFVCSLFAFVAAVYLVGETEDLEIQKIFKNKAKIANACAILLGPLLFIAAYQHQATLFTQFFQNPMSIASVLLSTILLVPLWICLYQKTQGFYKMGARILVSSQIALILLGWLTVQYPILFQGVGFSFALEKAAAPATTLRPLLGALIVGCALIFPALFYLLKVFKSTSVKIHH